MGAPELVQQLQSEGLTIIAERQNLFVGPRHLLTDIHRDLLRRHKEEVLPILPRRSWRVILPDREIAFICTQGINRDEVMQRYPQATDAIGL